MNNFAWKVAVMAAAAVAGAASTGAANSAARLPAIQAASNSNLQMVAMRSAPSWRRVTVRSRFFPYARRWHLGRSSEIGFGPRPTGQYRSFERLDRFPGGESD